MPTTPLTRFKRTARFLQKHLTLAFLITAIASILLDRLLLDPILDRLLAMLRLKPEVALVVTENYAMEMSGERLENVFLLYKTIAGKAFLAAANVGDRTIDRKYGVSLSRMQSVIDCPACTEYSFTLKNVGAATAHRIEIELVSTAQFKVIEEDIDPKTARWSCRRMATTNECYFRLENLDPGLDAFFTGLTEEGGRKGVRHVRCRVDGEDQRCLVNFRTFRIADATGFRQFGLGDRLVVLPAISSSPTALSYYFDVNSWEWKRIEKD